MLWAFFIKAKWSNHLQKPVYDCSRVFLPEDHPYRRVASIFNGKPERIWRPKIMRLTDWIRAYHIEKEKEMIELFDSNGEPVFDDPAFFDTYVEKMSIGLKMKSIFYELPYWEHIKIGHLLGPMHILKNVLSSLWSHISSNKSDTLVVMIDLIASNTKKRHWPIKETRGGVGPSFSFKEGDVPSILKKYDLVMAKDVIWVNSTTLLHCRMEFVRVEIT
jgi:hypothetical protein